MKRVFRALLLMLILGTFVSAAVPRVPAPDGGPIPTCRGNNCTG